MPHNTVNLTYHAGDNRPIDIQILDGAGQPVSFLAAPSAARFAVFPDLAGAVPIVDKTLGAGIGVEGDPALGTLRITMAKADTIDLAGVYGIEGEVIEAGGNDTTTLTGTIDFEPSRLR